MRPRIFTAWDENKARLKSAFGFSDDHLAQYDAVSDDDLADAYETMQLCRQFERARAGGWALVAEQLPTRRARSILRPRARPHQGQGRGGDDDRLTVVFCGEGGSQNGRLAEVLNVAAKESLPLLILCIDSGRAINTFTPGVAQNSEVWRAGEHYGVPGAKVDGQNLEDVLKTGRAVIDHVRSTSSPAILQVHTRLQGHSPADPEHERGARPKTWARAEADPSRSSRL
ncbi:pyruvate dehydrogenase [Aureococcus anophagefferens]|nr:pyruvate dehydrogenase [Aureococcus anophagefferens]